MKYINLIMLLILIMSCSEDTKSYIPLDNFYSLTNISCECSPIVIVPYQQQWKFDFNKSEIEVKTFGDEVEHLFFDQGKYSFELDTISNTDINLFKVEGRKYALRKGDDYIFLDSGTPSGISDLPLYIFEKN